MSAEPHPLEVLDELDKWTIQWATYVPEDDERYGYWSASAKRRSDGFYASTNQGTDKAGVDRRLIELIMKRAAFDALSPLDQVGELIGNLRGPQEWMNGGDMTRCIRALYLELKSKSMRDQI